MLPPSFRSNLLTGVFSVAMAIVVPTVVAAAEPKSPQVQALEAKVEMQDQRIRDLEKRLLAMEAAAASEKEAKQAPVAPAGDKEQTLATQSERQRIRVLEERVEAIESTATPAGSAGGSLGAVAAGRAPASIDVSSGAFREALKLETGAALASADFPGSWPMFGTDYRMKIGGYFKADSLYDFAGSGDRSQFLMAEIPVDGTPAAQRNSYLTGIVRETRFNFEFRKSTPGETPQKLFFEMDFFGGSNASNPRLRHAYVQYGNLIVGQTWSVLTDLRAINFMIDFAYGDAIFGGRTKQVRWQQQVNDNWSYAVGLEQLDFTGIDARGLAGSASPRLPALAGRLSFENSSALLVMGGVVQELRWDGEGLGPDATKTGWAAMMSGRYNLGRRDYVAGQVSYGRGAIENITALTGRSYNATLFPDGHLETNKAWSTSVSYAHKFNDAFSANLNFAALGVDADYQRPANTMKNSWIGHANIIWNITPALLTGFEYMYGETKNANGSKGDASRIQTMLMFKY